VGEWRRVRSIYHVLIFGVKDGAGLVEVVESIAEARPEAEIVAGLPIAVDTEAVTGAVVKDGLVVAGE
jgi:hypothetical protein